MAKRGKGMTDLTGKQIGEWSVIERGEDWVAKTGKGTAIRWICRCSCGKVSLVLAKSLVGGAKSCGHLINIKHGRSRTSEHNIWKAMRRRCNTKTDGSYHNYGGRGIRVCERWSEFTNFYADMGPRPPGMSIDRINNDGNYEPSNCRWASRLEQALNMRTTTKIDGVPLNIISERTGLSKACLRERMKHWPKADWLKPNIPPGYTRHHLDNTQRGLVDSAQGVGE